MSDIQGSKGPTGPKDSSYNPAYSISPELKKFWTNLFHNQQLSDDDLKKMTDQFIKQVSDDCKRVLDWAIKQQKERDQKEKEDRGG
jgi:hypothetical protein